MLFKLHYPENAVVGGGSSPTARWCRRAWPGTHSGTRTEPRRSSRCGAGSSATGASSPTPRDDYEIGCIILAEPFCFERRDWIAAPQGFARNTLVGKIYDLTTAEGGALWEEVAARRALARGRAAGRVIGPTIGDPALVRRRLGQGAFRILVTDAYEHHCAVTGERDAKRGKYGVPPAGNASFGWVQQEESPI